MKSMQLCFGVSLALLASLASGAADLDPAAYNGFDVRGASIPVSAIERGGPPRDGIPAIDKPAFVAADRAGLPADDRVLGLKRSGIARAYPVRIMNWHEVVNDRLGAEAIAVTYCPLCGTGMAFEARIGDRDLTFGVSGLLYNSDVLLYDRDTESLWSQIKQVAIAGRMRGVRLVSVPLEHTTWGDWRRRNPGTVVLSTKTGFERDYARDPYAGYEKLERLMFNVSHRGDRFPLKEWVLGLQVDGKPKAYPFSVLGNVADASGIVVDKIGDRTVRIEYDRAHRTARATDDAGRPIPAVMAFWFAWVAFHPETAVYRER